MHNSGKNANTDGCWQRAWESLDEKARRVGKTVGGEEARGRTQVFSVLPEEHWEDTATRVSPLLGSSRKCQPTTPSRLQQIGAKQERIIGRRYRRDAGIPRTE